MRLSLPDFFRMRLLTVTAASAFHYLVANRVSWYFRQSAVYSVAINWGPLSVKMASGMPWRAMCLSVLAVIVLDKVFLPCQLQ